MYKVINNENYVFLIQLEDEDKNDKIYEENKELEVMMISRKELNEYLNKGDLKILN